MKPIWRLWLRMILLSCGTSVLAAGVSITEDGGVRRAQTSAYEALVAEDGCLTSLKVGGGEFLASADRIPRGAYFYQGGPLRLPTVEQPAEDVVTARSEKASIRYEFGPDSLKWTLTNHTGERMLFIIVFDPAVNVVMGERGKLRKAPLEHIWRTSTWFRGAAKLRITGSTRLWGPWAGNHQVWEVALGPNETREVTLQPGAATDAEAARAAEVAATVQKPPDEPEGPMWDIEALSRPPKVRPAEGFQAEGVSAIFYDGPPFEKQPTRVFAWLGLPKVPAGERVPGMVLVHGGGGTAFADWVRLWNERGYAAIAMDTCGCTPGGAHGNRPRHEFGGPPGWGGFGQIDWPREDQWTYHAVADVILAHSLLRSLPEVDPERIGLTGISWGGYLTSIIAGVDPRFKFAAPVYGCGFTLDTAFAERVKALGEERAARWMRWWDPAAYLGHAAMPMLWVSGSNDFAYTFPALQKSYRLPQGPRTLCVRLLMPHGQGPGQKPEEIHAFADSFCKGGKPLARITGQGRDGDRVWATYEAAVPVVRAELNVTKDTGKWQDRRWEALPAQIEEPGKVTATLPDGVTVYYLNLVDERELIVSTEHVELPK